MEQTNNDLVYVGRIHRSLEARHGINCEISRNIEFTYRDGDQTQRRRIAEFSFSLPEINIAFELGARLNHGQWANTSEYYIKPNITFRPHSRWFSIHEYVPSAPYITQTSAAFFMNPKLHSQIGDGITNWIPEDTMIYQLTNQPHVIMVGGDLLRNNLDHPIFLSPIDQMDEKAQFGLGSTQCFNESNGSYLAITLTTVGNVVRDGTGMANHIPNSNANFIPVLDVTKNIVFRKIGPETQTNLMCSEFQDNVDGWVGYFVNSKNVPRAWIAGGVDDASGDGSINGTLEIPHSTLMGSWYIDIDVYAKKEHPYLP